MIDHRRAVANELLQHLVNELFAFQVDLAGGLVQDQDGRIAQDGPRQRDSLPLSARQPTASLADHVW